MTFVKFHLFVDGVAVAVVAAGAFVVEIAFVGAAENMIVLAVAVVVVVVDVVVDKCLALSYLRVGFVVNA